MSQSDATGRTFLYQGAFSDTHPIVHNLNSRWVSFTVWRTATGIMVAPADFDIVSVPNANELTIGLVNPEAITVRINT